MEAKVCEKCTSVAKVKGLCKPHYKQKWKLDNKERLRLKDKDYYQKHKDVIRKRSKNWYESNKEKALEYAKCKIAKDRKKHNKYVSNWAKNNKGKRNAIWAKYYTSKMRALPKWANLEKIKNIYNKCPKGYHVDHIIPLQGKNVCGLHVEYNLQYLTEFENKRKGNRYGNQKEN
jgi:hypothetical protein